MSKFFKRLVTPRDWPIAWKLTAIMLSIYAVALVAIWVVGITLVADSLIGAQQRELLERATEEVESIQSFREDHLLTLYNMAAKNGPNFLAGSQETIRWSLQNELLVAQDFLDLSFVVGDGTVLASTNASLEGQSFLEAPWFKTVSSRKAGISHLQRFADLQEPAFVFHVPIPNDPSIHALVGRLPVSLLWGLVDRVRVRESGYAFIADDNIVAIAHGLPDSDHKFVFYAIGEIQGDPRIEEANERGVYGIQQIEDAVEILPLAEFLRGGVPRPSPEDPAPNIHRYYWDVQDEDKTAVAVPVAPPRLDNLEEVDLSPWTFCITVNDEEFMQPLARLWQGLAIVFGIGDVAVIVITILLSRSFTRPILRLADTVANVERGAYDKRFQMDRDDELGRLGRGLNTMLDRIVEGLRMQQGQLTTMTQTGEQVREDAELVSTSAEEVAAATEQLNASAEEVATTVHAIARDAYGQMSQVQRTADAIQELDQEITQVAELSKQMEASSDRIRILAEQTEYVVTEADDKSRQIEGFVRKIEKFSRQTNLLALNATIEAARAGEMGESFAVVADEVRRLAEDSRQALTEVRGLNESIQESIGTIGEAMEQTKMAIVEGVALAEEVAETAARQAAASQSLIEAVNRLAAIAEKNAAGSEQMAAVVEEQTAAFQEISFSSQELAGLALREQALAEQLIREGAEQQEGSHDDL
jgi:methyl-accepting chemotaxis protein